eukprot:gene6814-7919_t
MASSSKDGPSSSNKPANTAFKQQRLKAWEPILTPTPVIISFIIIGIVFVPIGSVMINASNKVVESSKRYDTDCEIGNVCEITIPIEKTMKAPVYMYYELDNFYQNHRRYVKSRNDDQLRGVIVNTYDKLADCEPFKSEGDSTDPSKFYLPCGLIAKSMFNDTFVLRQDNTTIPLQKEGIAWASDRNKKFKNPPAGAPGIRVIEDFTDEDFIVWMRTAGLPRFKKLYRIINQDIKKGEVVVEVKSNYPVRSFEGKKSIVLSTTTWIGGKNTFLGWAYIVVGVVCFLQGIVFLIKHKISPRKLGDPKDTLSKELTTSEIQRLKQYEEDLQMNASLADFHLGTFYSQGVGVKEDADLALKWFKSAADHDLAEGQYALGMSYITGSSLNVFRPIFPSLKKERRDKSMTLGEGWVSTPDAPHDFDYRKWLREERMRLGMILLKGSHGLRANADQGVYWLKKAEENNDLNAIHELGKYFYSLLESRIESGDISSDQTTQLLEQATFFFNKASELGHADSSYWLGSTYLSGPTETSRLKGVEYLDKATQQGSASAATLLSMLYREGIDPVTIDTDKFHQYLKLGVSGKDPVALLTLGELYFNGAEGYDINYKKALYYFSESASLGNSDACLNQGVMYYNGYGTEVDFETAFYCYQNSYQFNPQNLAAISNLYMMHRDGVGVPKSMEMATFYSGLLTSLQDPSPQDSGETMAQQQ